MYYKSIAGKNGLEWKEAHKKNKGLGVLIGRKMSRMVDDEKEVLIIKAGFGMKTQNEVHVDSTRNNTGRQIQRFTNPIEVVKHKKPLSTTQNVTYQRWRCQRVMIDIANRGNNNNTNRDDLHIGIQKSVYGWITYFIDRVDDIKHIRPKLEPWRWKHLQYYGMSGLISKMISLYSLRTAIKYLITGARIIIHSSWYVEVSLN